MNIGREKLGMVCRSKKDIVLSMRWNDLLCLAIVLAVVFTIFSSVVVADSSIEEDNTSVLSCLANCTGGFCLNAKASLQINLSGVWNDLDYFVGNVLLNGSALNPIVLGTINTSVQANFTVVGGNYSFQNQLRCNITSDYASDFSPVILVNVTDTKPPSVTLLLPPDNAARDPGIINFTVSATDNRLVNCTLYGNWTPGFPANQTFNLTSGQNVTYTNISLTYGKYVWNAKCADAAGNAAFAAANFTLNVAGDLSINSTQIWFSPAAPSASANLTIFVNVTNRANRSEVNVVTGFYENDPDLGGTLLGNVTSNFSGLQTKMFNISWKTAAGPHNIFAVVDPPFGSGSIVEADESNNKANNSFVISMWQYYYGTLNSTIVLFDSNLHSFSTWPVTNVTGNIYVSDTDTTNGINFAFLKELGRNITGGSNAQTSNDFEDLDNSTMLNTSQYPDSINTTFTSGGSPRQVAPFIVFGHTLQNVPVVNSTNSSNFITGILWDTDDSSNAYFDTADREDVIFITNVNAGKVGKYGTYDYEIRIPAMLKSYKGATNTVTFYYEIT